MKLADYQRAVVRVSLSLGPSEQDLAQLGSEARFADYRAMVRSRLLGMARTAFKSTVESVGQEQFASSFARFLALEGPRSPFIRDVIASFGDFAQTDRQLLTEAPAHTADLLCFEQAKWWVSYQECATASIHEFDFERPLALNPARKLLTLQHAVHEPERARRATLLFVYRPPVNDQVRWYAGDAFFHGLLSRAGARSEPFAETVRSLAGERGLSVDQPLVETLSSSLAVALERGLVLGSW